MYPSNGYTLRADIGGKVEEFSKGGDYFIADQVLPQIPVDAKSGNYPKLQIAAGELATPASTLRSRGGAYGEITRNWNSDTYDTVDRGLEEAVDDAEAKDLARFFQLEVSTAKWLMRNMRLDYEARVVAQVINTTNFPATAAAVNYTEALIATINFPKDLADACERVQDKGEQANTVIMSAQVLNRLRRSTILQSYLRGAMPNDATLRITAQALTAAFSDFGIEKVLVGRARNNTAKKGQAAVQATIWPYTHIWVGYINPNTQDLTEVGMGATLVWNKEGGLFVTESYRDERRRSNMLRVRQNTVEKIINSNAGTLITTNYS